MDYKWTNYEDDEETFIFNIGTAAYQNGMKCEENILQCTGFNPKLQSAKVLSGATVIVQEAYSLYDSESDVTLFVNPIFSDDVIYKETIRLP